MILAGDVGGTWTRLALLDDRATRIVARKTTPSHDHPTLEHALDAFAREQGARITRVGIGIAGPVVRGVSKTTNLPWTVSEAALRSSVRAKQAVLLNDLVAFAWGAPSSPVASLRSLANGLPRTRGANVAVLAAGTGLGEGALVWGGREHVALGTEGGHGDFAPLSETQHELLRFARGRFGHVSYERIVSGPGIGLIYDFFLSLSCGASTRTEEDARIESSADRHGAIVTAAKSGVSTIAREAIETFIDVYGAEAGNLALRTLSHGGVYIGGGIAASLIEGDWAERFMRAFVDKGRMKGLLSAIPVAVVLGGDVGIFGAARAARAGSLASRARL